MYGINFSGGAHMQFLSHQYAEVDDKNYYSYRLFKFGTLSGMR